MASIKISELRPAGSELFADAESYMSDLTTEELQVKGGLLGAGTVSGVSGAGVSGVSNNNQVGGVGQSALGQQLTFQYYGQ